MMRSIIAGASITVLVTVSGFAETIITADTVVDSDVVLESAVKEVKSIPSDAGNMVGDVIIYAKEETDTAVNAVKDTVDSFKKDAEKSAHLETKKDSLEGIEDAWDSGKDILFRSYKVSDRIGDLLQAYAIDKSASAVDVADFFKNVEFPEKTSARYLPEFHSLFVHQTQENLPAIEGIIASYQREQKNLMGRQVEIEAKFIEVNAGTMNELGFDWTFNSNNGGPLRLFDDNYLSTATGGQDILSAGLRKAATALGGGPASGMLNITKNTGALQWSLAINALEQADDSDVLSAPRLVTQSHESAVIQVGEERMVPKSFEVDNQNTSPYVQHGDWELELMGVYMEVTPEIRHDGLIDLELNTQVLDIIGHDSYSITPDHVYYTGLNKSFPDSVAGVDASLPYFRIRKLDTRVTVSDGSTIGMGGLIYDRLETFRDKVPVLGSIPYLGRLFRSEGERSVKRNLVIFVSATQVDVHGRRAADLVLNK